MLVSVSAVDKGRLSAFFCLLVVCVIPIHFAEKKIYERNFYFFVACSSYKLKNKLFICEYFNCTRTLRLCYRSNSNQIFNLMRYKPPYDYFFYHSLKNTIKCISVRKRQKLTKMLEEVFAVLKRVDAVCFDVDSTVIREEGIDELAKFCEKGSEIADLTIKAMTGTMTFQESLHVRLGIIQPSLAQVKDFIRMKPPTLTPGIKTLVDVLHKHHIPIYLISGGFRCIIAPIADQLKIPQDHIYANRLKFYYTGEFAGFDEQEPTSKSGGKGVVIQHLKSTYGYKNLILIGDGATDAEACPPADAFIGYGGNVIRPIVKAKAKWFVTDFNEITNVLTNQQSI